MSQLEYGKISGRQLMSLLVLVRLVPMALICPTILTVKDMPVAWVNDLLGSVIALPLIFLLVRLGLRFPDKTIIEYSEVLLGPIAGKAIGFLVFAALFITVLDVARAFGEVFTVSIMEQTPILVFILLVVSICANGARIGLEIPGRFSEIFAGLTIIVLILVAVLPYDAMNFDNLKPFYLQNGLSDLVAPTGSVVSFYLEFLVIGMLIPYLNRPQDAMRYTLIAVSICMVILVSICVVLISVFGPLANTLALPAFDLARIISIGDFIEHVEGLIVTVWMVAAGVKLTLFLWATSLGLSQLLGLKTFHPVVYPLSALAVPLSLISWRSLIDLENFLVKPWILFVLPFTPLLLMILYIAYGLRGGRVTDEEASRDST